MSVRIATGGAAEEAVGRVLPRLVEERIASGITAQDPSLWGAEAEAGAAGRLGWTEAVADARPLVATITRLRDALAADGADRVVLCGTGETSRAAAVLARTLGAPLTVLDSTDPDRVRAVLGEGIERTAVVIASKSGTTLETDCHRRSFTQAFREAGLDPARRTVVVTDPGSPLEASAREMGSFVVTADPTASGAFCALTAFGLLPAGLAGVDLEEVVDEAESELLDLAIDSPANNGLVLGAAIAGAVPRRGALALVTDGSHLHGFGDWVEQLVAESTGKLGTGLLPLVLAPDAPELEAPPPDLQVVRFVADAHAGAHRARLAAGEILVSGSLGELLLVWQYALAVAARLIGVDPFDRPDVEATTAATRVLLASPSDEPPADLVRSGVELRATPGLPVGTDLGAALEALAAAAPSSGYLAVQAFAAPPALPAADSLRDLLARRLRRPVPLGRGPRYLHSTGQYQKGGPATGAFLQITAPPTSDLAIPGLPFTYGALIRAQARADAAVLARRGRPVLRAHLAAPEAMDALAAAARRPS